MKHPREGGRRPWRGVPGSWGGGVGGGFVWGGVGGGVGGALGGCCGGGGGGGGLGGLGGGAREQLEVVKDPRPSLGRQLARVADDAEVAGGVRRQPPDHAPPLLALRGRLGLVRDLGGRPP